MIPATIDPTLTAGEPMPETLVDGFSPPAAEPLAPAHADGAAPVEPVLGDKSPF